MNLSLIMPLSRTHSPSHPCCTNHLRSLQLESERIQATAQSREEMLTQLRELVDYEIREAADLQVWNEWSSWGNI